MNSRKKLQKKEASARIPKKYLEYEVSGGLCAVLGEECCFYVNHSGVIREALAKIREGLSQRKKRKRNVCLNSGSTHLPGSQISFLPLEGP